MESFLPFSTGYTTYPYQLKALFDVPRRIFKPPKPDAPRIGRVRALSLTPVYNVKLEDVLAGKHLPPLALPEFEAYLMYVERSPENLYFMLWFKDYEKQYQAWTRSPTYPQQSRSLAYSYSRAKQTFLIPLSAPLELNLPEATISALFTADPPAHPPPSAFADMRHQVEVMLGESLINFVRVNASNCSGRTRGFFAIGIGLSLMCVGLAPILVSALDRKSRWLRFACLPCFWLGATTLICGLHGICIVIFLFGDARQLRAYELARPKISHRTLTDATRSQQRISLQHIASRDHIELTLPETAKTIDHPQHLSPPNASRVNTSPEIYMSPSHAADEKFLPSGWMESCSPSSPEAIAPFLSTPPALLGDSTFDFNHLPTSRLSETNIPDGSSIWAPMTKVLDSISIRTYWETVMRSAALALIISLILVGISVGVE